MTGRKPTPQDAPSARNGTTLAGAPSLSERNAATILSASVLLGKKMGAIFRA